MLKPEPQPASLLPSLLSDFVLHPRLTNYLLTETNGCHWPIPAGFAHRVVVKNWTALHPFEAARTTGTLIAEDDTFWKFTKLDSETPALHPYFAEVLG